MVLVRLGKWQALQFPDVFLPALCKKWIGP